MNVLITGSGGYLGGRLASHMASCSRHSLFLGSRNAREVPFWAPRANMVQTHWDSLSALEEICSGMDAIIHLAGMNAQDCAADPAGAVEINAVAAARLVQAAARKGVKRFIYLSTAHVYGAPLTGEITEEKCPANLHPYASSHRAGEDAVRLAHQKGEIEGVVIRLSNAFGVPMDESVNCWMLLVNDLCRQVAVEQRMTLHSSGSQRRNFVPMSDVCAAIVHLLELPSDTLGDGVYNVGGETLSVMEMAEMVRIRCEVRLGFLPEMIRPGPAADEEVPALRFSSEKLFSTGFSPAASTEREIDATLQLCQEIWGRHGG